MLQLNINLGDIRVVTDEYNYIVQVRKVTEKGKAAGTEYWQSVSYHGNLEQVSRALLDMRLTPVIVEAHNLRQIEATIRYMAKQIEKAIKGAM